MSLRVDCLKNEGLQDVGNSEDCLKLTGLRVSYEHLNAEKFGSRLTLNPFLVRDAGLRSSPLTKAPQSDPLFFVEDFYFIYQPIPHLEMGIENFRGFSYYPKGPLAFGSSFVDAGWDQLAVSLALNMAAMEEISLKLTVGNGEGELPANQNSQGFVAMEGVARIVQMLSLSAGVSFNGNHAGSLRNEAEQDSLQQLCGINRSGSKNAYSHRRVMAGLAFKGTERFLAGLSAGGGWQQSLLKDLSREEDGFLNRNDFSQCSRLNEDLFFLEDAKHETENSMGKETLNMNLSYRFFDRFMASVDFEQRRIESDLPAFTTCLTVGENSCAKVGDSELNLFQWAYTLGLGAEIHKGLELLLEYNYRSYDQDYEKFFFPSDSGPSPSRARFNARVAYRWDSI